MADCVGSALAAKPSLHPFRRWGRAQGEVERRGGTRSLPHRIRPVPRPPRGRRQPHEAGAVREAALGEWSVLCPRSCSVPRETCERCSAAGTPTAPRPHSTHRPARHQHCPHRARTQASARPAGGLQEVSLGAPPVFNPDPAAQHTGRVVPKIFKAPAARSGTPTRFPPRFIPLGFTSQEE